MVGKRKILVMDDEEMVRDVVKGMLRNLKYDFEPAKDGSEAIEKYKRAMESGKPFDAVIMDLTVPGGMGGKEAIKKLIEIDPKVKAIVSSGNFNDPIMANFRKYGFSGAIAKPYTNNELGQTLQKLKMENCEEP
jgi:CheY-like chemotaxis protein